MKLSFNSWLYGSAFGWLPCRSLEDTIDTLAEIGYDGIEIGAGAPHGFPDFLDESRRKAIRQRVEGKGMEVSALCPALGGAPGYNPASPDEAERCANLEYITKCIELASDLNCKNVIWLAGWRRYGQPRTEAWNYAVESLQKCAEVAQRNGVCLDVEPTTEVSDVLDHAGDALRMLNDAGVGGNAAGVMLDTIHVFVRRDEVRDQFREAGDRLVYVHISDLHRDPPGTHVHFGSACDELKKIGYDGWLSMEVGFNRQSLDPDGIARASLAHMKDALEGPRESWGAWKPSGGLGWS